MLYPETVEGRTFDLLIALSKDSVLNDFFLVGGTALSLQLGHRRSIDLDLFTRESFDTKQLNNYLQATYSNHTISIQTQFANTLMIQMDGIKVDFIKHR